MTEYIKIETMEEHEQLCAMFPFNTALSNVVLSVGVSWTRYGYRTIENGLQTNARSAHSEAYVLFKDYLLIHEGKNPLIIQCNKKLMDGLAKIEEAKGIIETINAHPEAMVGISTEEEGKYSFARTAEHTWNVQRRVRTSFQKIMRHLGSEEKDHILSGVAAKLAPILWPCPIKILKGKDISSFYSDNSSSIPSCMTDEDCTAMYAENPDNVSLAVIEVNGVGKARCILLKDDEGKLWHSRVYGRRDEDRETMFDALAKLGYTDAYSEGIGDAEITLDMPANKFIPYMDVFYRTSDIPSSGSLTFGQYGCYEARSTGGELEGLNICAHCGEVCSETRYVSGIGDLCDDCIEEHTFVCDRCGDRTRNGAMREVGDESWRVDCRDNYASTCNDCGKWFANRDLDDGLCESCVEKKEEDSEEQDTEQAVQSDVQDIKALTMTCSEAVDRVVQTPEFGNVYIIPKDVALRLNPIRNCLLINSADAIACRGGWIEQDPSYHERNARWATHAIRVGNPLIFNEETVGL